MTNLERMPYSVDCDVCHSSA